MYTNSHTKITLGLLLTSLMLSLCVEAKPNPKAEVTIQRDEYGTPHVFGSTDASLWYGVGYAMAEDRLWQAEVLRRTARGRTAELFGPGALPGDISLRTVTGSEAARQAQFDSASEQVQQILTHYAAGINAYIEDATSADNLPPEFAAFGFTPEPWQPTDSINILQMLWFDVGYAGREELTHATHLQQLKSLNGEQDGNDIFADTRWLDDPDAPTTVPVEGAVNSVAKNTAKKPKVKSAPAPESNTQHGGIRSGLDAARENLRRVGMGSGSASNAVVIGSKLSATGRPLLLSGSQVGYAVPQLGHEMGYHSRNHDIFGTGVAGVPLVVLGLSRDSAWTATTGGSDNQDIYAERINPENPQQYWFIGEWRDYDCRDETFGIAGNPEHTQTICESIHGPVLTRNQDYAYTMKSAGRGREVQSFKAFLDFTRSRTLMEADQALENFPVNLNILYADRRGNIAHWHAGLIPVRQENDNPWLPHEGTGTAEWLGYIPWGQMPHSVNPDQGWISSWNNKPAAGWKSARLNFWSWGPVHRVQALNDELSKIEPATATLETLKELNISAGWRTQTPTNTARNVFVPKLLAPLIELIDSDADDRLPEVVEILSNWDSMQLDLAPTDGYYDDPSVAIFNTWWAALTDRIFSDELGPLVYELDNTLASMVYRLISEAPALPLQHDYLDGETASEAITAALISALDRLTSDYASTEPADWLQPISEILWSPIGVGSVPNTIWMNRGTYNYLVEHGPGQHLQGMSVMPPGQSGNPLSPHFSDQLENYANWQYKPLKLKRSDLVGTVQSEKRLKVGGGIK